jgi:hypothetical protein
MYIHDPIEVEQKPLGIPYHRPDSDLKSHGYVNLRQQPEMVEVLPELQGCTPLRDFVAALNKGNSPFETLGCEKWSAPWAHEKFPGFIARHGSYVDIALLEKSKCSTPDVYHDLVREFRTYAEQHPVYDVMHVHFVLRPTVSMNQTWWTLEYWNYGIGRTDEEAERWWAEGLRYFQSFLEAQAC